MSDSKHLNIFGTTFCIPKGYERGKGYTIIECSLPIESRPIHREETIKRIRKEREIIRTDIERAFSHFGGKHPSEEEFKEFLKKHPADN